MNERAISVRLDEEASAALDELVRAGMTQSGAVRTGLIEAVARRRQRMSLAAEAMMLASNEDDLREVAEVRAFMDELRAPW